MQSRARGHPQAAAPYCDEPGVHFDGAHRCEGPRHRAGVLGRPRHFLELLIGYPRDARAGLEPDACDREAVAGLLDRHRGRRVDALGLVPGPPEVPGQRHRIAARVSGRDQLLRVGAFAVLEARLERIGPLVGAASEAHRSVALGERSSPAGARSPVRHVGLLVA